MKASISFNLSDKKEILKIDNKEKEFYICSKFINILSINTTDIIKIIDNINYSDDQSVIAAYNTLYDIDPLLLLNEFNIKYIVKHRKNLSDYIKKLEITIENLKSTINSFVDTINKTVTDSLMKELDFLRNQQKSYRDLNNNYEKSLHSLFNRSVLLIKKYQKMVDKYFIISNSEPFDGYSSLPAVKKYIYHNMYKTGNLFEKMPPSNVDFTFDCDSNDFFKKLDDANNKNRNIFTILFEENISPMYEYICTDLDQFLQVSFFVCLTQDLKIKKCENCQKYFIAYSRIDEKYCNRISPQDSNKTCKQYTNLENWKNNLLENAEAKLYRQIYMAKQMKSRRSPNDIKLYDDFVNWRELARKKRNEYIHNKISKEQYIEWLNSTR